MNHVRLYIDEDAMDTGVVRGLRARPWNYGIDVMTASDVGMICRTDEDHLSFAAAQGRALYSFNVRDFPGIHSDWMAADRDHGGIILAPQQRCSIGEQIRRLLRLIASVSAEAMRNRQEFLGSW